MATIASAARINLKGFSAEGIDAYSPLEDQVVLTYRAAYHYADINHFEPHVHRGVQGRKGPMVMKRITDALFDHADKDVRDKLNGLISQVLRKTDAAVCIAHPKEREQTPTWFIADSLPPNITIVALSHAHGESRPTPRATLTPTYAESKLTPDEAGETKTPGEVTVQKQPIAAAVQTAFAETRDRKHQEHLDFVERVYAAVKEHAPIAAGEMRTLLGDFTTEDSSAIRNCLAELEKAGRVVKRKEEDAERRIRGGGSFPKGGRVFLFGLAPGPVPERTGLPPGITPRKAAKDWDTERQERLDGWADKVLAVLSKTYRRDEDETRPRSVGPISQATGLTLEETQAGLNRLVALKMIVRNGSRYHVAGAPRSGQVRLKEDATAGQEPTTASQPVVLPPPPAPAPTDRTQIAAEFLRMAHLLAEPTGTEEILRLTAKVEELEETNAKQARIIVKLRAVIAEME